MALLWMLVQLERLTPQLSRPIFLGRLAFWRWLLVFLWLLQVKFLNLLGLRGWEAIGLFVGRVVCGRPLLASLQVAFWCRRWQLLSIVLCTTLNTLRADVRQVHLRLQLLLPYFFGGLREGQVLLRLRLIARLRLRCRRGSILRVGSGILNVVHILLGDALQLAHLQAVLVQHLPQLLDFVFVYGLYPGQLGIVSVFDVSELFA